MIFYAKLIIFENRLKLFKKQNNSNINILLKREIITTSDGSKTIRIEDWNESYHSKHGALNEAVHVFIKTGLRVFSRK